MAPTLPIVRLESAWPRASNASDGANIGYRDKVPDWAKDEEAKRWQEHLWGLIVKEIETAEPGCVRKALQK
jgi:hypothetical protein